MHLPRDAGQAWAANDPSLQRLAKAVWESAGPSPTTRSQFVHCLPTPLSTEPPHPSQPLLKFNLNLNLNLRKTSSYLQFIIDSSAYCKRSRLATLPSIEIAQAFHVENIQEVGRIREDRANPTIGTSKGDSASLMVHGQSSNLPSGLVIGLCA